MRLASSDASEVLGSTLPRIVTPPLVTGPPGPCGCGCALTPETSYGYGVIKFGRDVIGIPLDPWEAYAAIHLGELLPDGRPRFATILILVARQNGKTTLAKILVLYWLFVERVGSVLNTSTDRSYAKKFWHQVCALAKGNEWLSRRLGPDAIRLTISEEMLTTLDSAVLVDGDPVQFTFAANNGRAGRSMTLTRWLCDELREHTNRETWDAATYAQNAVPGSQTVCITNQGGDSAVVLDSLRESALKFIETGVGDRRVGLIEWSAPDGADPEDVHALAAANPNAGRRLHWDDLLGPAATAKAAGGEDLAGFRTEVMCQRVRQLDPAIDPDAWLAGLELGDLTAVRSRVALVLDVAPDERHATLTAAAVLPDGRARVEPVASWDDMRVMRRELAGKVARVRPQAFGWFPNGPAVAYAALLRTTRKGWPLAGVAVEEIKGDTPAVCMGFAEQVRAGQIVHSGDPLQDAHVAGAEKFYKTGGLWIFSRKGGHCDAAYAAAGAVHLARTLPPPVGRPRLLVAE